MTRDEAAHLLEQHGQAHVLRFWDDLDSPRQESLLQQVAEIDFDNLSLMRRVLGERTQQGLAAPDDMEPAAVVDLEGAAADAARDEGEHALRSGKVGAILVAGGQGSRLGFDGPKGCFPIGPITEAPLFAVHARKILALERRFKTSVPFYIMTSRANDEPTRECFRCNDWFALCPERVRFFVQGMWPALRDDGAIVLDRRGHIFMSPDGHGGILTALKKHGLLDEMASRGLETLFYFQVDNPLVEIADPIFVGAHRLRGSDMSVKVCAKRDPSEGLGVVARRQGRDMVAEYTELTDQQREARLADGRLKFLYGSVAIHAFSLAFLKRVSEEGLPLHLAHKKVPSCEADGRTVKPPGRNAYKFEKFIFDALPYAEKTLNLVFRREDEFAPVKNASGNDSPETARQGMIRKFGRWLETCGIDVPADEKGSPIHKIEIDPCYAMSARELKQKLPAGFRVDGDVLLEDE